MLLDVVNVNFGSIIVVLITTVVVVSIDVGIEVIIVVIIIVRNILVLVSNAHSYPVCKFNWCEFQ